MYARGYKSVADSKTEMTRIVQYDDINGGRRLFGGRLMEWIDEVAGICAIRHCGGYVTTACVDNLQFRRGAALNDIIVVKAHLTHVGRTSMEVRVDTYVEEKQTGIRRLINYAYVTEVYIGEDDKPAEIPYGLELKTEVEKAEWEGAAKRNEIRKQRRREGY
ncbi:MAG: acyl-CoA thioesterase [Bilifractor sp.]|jgi:acyl-CoA hydrolase